MTQVDDITPGFWYIPPMRRLKALFEAFLLLGILTACAANRYSPSEGTQRGIASWYGRDFNGKPTASGEVYNMYDMTAAHREMPLGTAVEVTNLDNGKHARVVINDRGPFVGGRIIDLSYAAAKDLDMVEAGTARVSLRVTGRDRKYVREVRVEDSGHGEYYAAQLGAFIDRDNAERLKAALGWKHSDAYIEKAEVRGRTFYRVRAGRFRERDKTFRLARTLAEEGYPVIVIRAEK